MKYKHYGKWFEIQGPELKLSLYKLFSQTHDHSSIFNGI